MMVDKICHNVIKAALMFIVVVLYGFGLGIWTGKIINELSDLGKSCFLGDNERVYLDPYSIYSTNSTSDAGTNQLYNQPTIYGSDYPELGCQSYQALLVTLLIVLIMALVIIIRMVVLAVNFKLCRMHIITSLSLFLCILSFLFLGLYIEIGMRKRTFKQILIENDLDSSVDWGSFNAASPLGGFIWFGILALITFLILVLERRHLVAHDRNTLPIENA